MRPLPRMTSVAWLCSLSDCWWWRWRSSSGFGGGQGLSKCCGASSPHQRAEPSRNRKTRRPGANALGSSQHHTCGDVDVASGAPHRPRPRLRLDLPPRDGLGHRHPIDGGAIYRLCAPGPAAGYWSPAHRRGPRANLITGSALWDSLTRTDTQVGPDSWIFFGIGLPLIIAGTVVIRSAVGAVQSP
jgi:hypothetical protein